uniref:Copalyl diphosphate synthase 3 n=1 Tax=Andrographis paniculata TaxID=175694 RepID=A0A3G1AQT8_ANDPA|nr:copalyl diphosphate synthase 3 [Andrographis paniculata]
MASAFAPLQSLLPSTLLGASPASRRAAAGVFQPSKASGLSTFQCRAVQKSQAESLDLPVKYYWQQKTAVEENDRHEEEDALQESKESDKVRNHVELIRSMLQSMGDGEITVSPYDTAWVAMVEDIAGGGKPQFPSSLDWISGNQLSDGSWGDAEIFSIYDRIINTLGCVAALKTWNLHPHQAQKGISFIKENIHKLQDENEEHMPIGFEVAMPSLMDIAKKLDIDIPYEAPALQEIYQRREIKLKKIPRQVMHTVPTTLLHSLEGMPDLVWEKLLKLQSSNGSFLFSPSSTAFALQQTKDEKCLGYLGNMVQKFNGGVPNVYPVDLFEHIWAVDRLQRLGISRYFQSEIDECVHYVHRYWTNRGICWARDSEVQDIDDTAMAFRLMRMQGYEVSSDVFKNFMRGGEFFCFVGQSSQAVTGMYNLYRASQLMFPGEDILSDARKFSAKYLQEKRADNQLLDKWIITKDLPGEVGYALDVPWYASLPRLETRFFLDQYGGHDDVWIGKTLYRMPYVNNDTYLELAKLDYSNCQALHQDELRSIQKWCRKFSLAEFGLTGESLLQAYYIAAASIFAPEQALERLTWAKTVILVETLVSHFDHGSKEQKLDFVNEFELAWSSPKYNNGARYNTKSIFGAMMIRAFNQISLDIQLAHCPDDHNRFNDAWRNWLNKWIEAEDDPRQGEAELQIEILNLSSCATSQELSPLLHSEYQQLMKATVAVCDQLHLHQSLKDANGGISTAEIESSMQQLAKLVLKKSSMDSALKKNFLTVARSFYYRSYFGPETINSHIDKVLFERVL